MKYGLTLRKPILTEPIFSDNPILACNIANKSFLNTMVTERFYNDRSNDKMPKVKKVKYIWPK